MANVQNGSWFERNPKKTLLFTFFVCYILIDISLGFILLPREKGVYNQNYHHDLKKDSQIRLKWGKIDYSIYTNSLGFKDSKRNKINLKSPKYRILFIGDSFTEGVGYPYEKTFIGLINLKLNEQKIEILNAGVVSYSPKLYYLKVKYLLEEVKLRFNELYVFIDICDINDEINYQNYKPSRSWLTIFRKTDGFFKQHSYTFSKMRKYIYSFAKHIIQPQVSPALLNPSQETLGRRDTSVDVKNKQKHKTSHIGKLDTDSLNKLYIFERSGWTYDKSIFYKWGKKGLHLAEENMERLFFLCRRYGIKMTIAVYPWPAQVLKRDLDSVQVKFWKKFCDKYDIKFINYFPEFINDMSPEMVIANYFILGDIHWNEKGHELIASKLLNEIPFLVK